MVDQSYTVSLISDSVRQADMVSVEARIRPGARWLPHIIEANIRAFLSDFTWATSGDQLEGWEDITVFEDVVESIVVAETCKALTMRVIAEQIANGADVVRLEDADIEIHSYTMSSEADGTIAGELSGKLSAPLARESSSQTGDEDEEKDDRTPSAAITKSLPSEDLDELWGK
jgi:hypothetical protein